MKTIVGTSWLVAILCVTPMVLSSAEMPFSITITTPKDVVKVGSQVRVSVILKNISGQDISFPRSPSEDLGEVFSEVEVRDAEGKLLPETKYYHVLKGKSDGEDKSKSNSKFEPPLAFHGSIILFDLKPGGTLNDGIILNKLFDIERPGRYTIRVGKLDVASKMLVTSNTITVTVID